MTALIPSICFVCVGQACEKLKDFRKNALDVRKLRDTEVPSRTSTLYFVNEAKRRENSLADMTHGERKLQDESTSACYIFQRDNITGY